MHLGRSLRLFTRETDGVDPATAREVVRVVREIKSLKRRADLLDGRPSDVLAEIERLDGKLAALEPRVGGDADLRARVGEARNWLDAARMGLSGFGGVADDPGSALAGAGPEGTMSGSATGGEGVPDVPGRSRVDRRDDEAPSPAVPTPGHDTGTTAETWWPPEYDRIVAGWTEWRRHALQNRAAGEDRDER